MSETTQFADNDLTEANITLENLSALQRIEWALDQLPANFMLSSSFGIQSAVLLHMVTRVMPDIPVVVVDTGYLFQETYQFIEELTDRLDLNLKMVTPHWSSARLEAVHGKLWEQGLEGLSRYNHLMKTQPMEAALDKLDIQSWFAGLRRSQSTSRQSRSVLEQRADSRYKIYPLIDWHNRDIHDYLTRHNLPYHPLWDKGYVSVGDWHTSRPLTPGMREQDTRFFGLQRECGLHT